MTGAGALSASEAARLVERHPAAIVAAGGDGRIETWAGSATALFGWAAADVLGRPLQELFAAPLAEDLAEMLGAGGAGDLRRLAPCRRRDGQFMGAVTVRRSGAGMVAVIRPAGSAFATGFDGGRPTPVWERTLGRLVGGLSAVAGRDLASIERTDALARVLVDEARLMVPGTEVVLSLVPAERQANFRIIATAGAWAETLAGAEWPRAGTVAGRAMQMRTPIETVRLDEQSVLRETLDAGRITTGRLVPLWTPEPLPDGRDAVGVLGWYRADRRYFTPAERGLMAEFCRLASLMLQRTELAATAARSAERLEAIVDAAREMTQTLEAPAILDTLVERALVLARAERAIVLRVDGGRMTVVAGRDLAAGQPPVGAQAPLAALVTDDGVELVRAAMESGSPALGLGYQVAGLHTGLEARPVRHSVALPVAVARQPALVLLCSRRSDEAFTRGDTESLETLAGIAGLALRNAGLFAEVEAADRVKTDFLNMAAHELRTPLTVMRGYLSMMIEGSFGELPGTWVTPVELLREKSDELGRLVDELLMAARLETGRLTASPEPIDLNDLARQAVEGARARAAGAGASLRLEPARRPLVVNADPEHMLRVLEALIGNALVYAGGTPWIRVRARAGAGGEAEVEVEDRGVGIPEQHHDAVFERFSRVSEEVQVAGTGLGLYIARELARRAGGRLELAWSAPGHGSRFVLALPEIAVGPAD